MRDRLGTPIYVFGDPAYQISDVILRAPKGTNLTPAMEEYASRMSHYRETVEWVFGKMGELWPFVTDVRRKTTGSRATSKEDCVAALLTNYHTCRYGGVANSYLKTTPPTMRAYRSMYTIDYTTSNGRMLQLVENSSPSLFWKQHTFFSWISFRCFFSGHLFDAFSLDTGRMLFFLDTGSSPIFLFEMISRCNTAFWYWARTIFLAEW